MNKRMIACFFVLFCLPVLATAQRITWSDPERSDDRDINFDIIGKLNANVLVYKNIRWKHAISVYNNAMELKERVALEFMPDRTFNVDFITYPDFVYMIYQHQRKNIVYCMGIKIDSLGHAMGDPVQLDTTKIDLTMNNKIYTTINSDDKKQVMIFKIYRKQDKFHFVTLLFNDKLELQRKSRHAAPYDSQRDAYGDFLVDNAGNFVFTKGERSGGRDNIGKLQLITKAAASDSFVYHELKLKETYLDELKLKIDNVNKRYIINSLYYKQRRGTIEGLFTMLWDVQADSAIVKAFNPFSDSLRIDAKTGVQLKNAFNDFFIRQVIVKKDGGFILIAEDYSTQVRNNGFGNGWNRWDYLNSPFLSPYDYYLYSPSYNWYYRPLNTFGSGMQSTRFFYDKVVIVSMDSGGNIDWTNVVHKDQFEDDNDNYLSYGTMTAAGELHFFFNEQERRNKVVSWQSLTPGGNLRRNATLKADGKGYLFMPRFLKQTGARQMVVPCTYRGNICFAKVDF